MYIVICNGTIIDGTGRTPFPADIVISQGRIVDIGATEVPDDAQILDASECIVSPGFIDIHSHSDFTLLVDPRAVSSITQGVTMEVVGNCGHGCAPIRDAELARSNIYGF